MDSNPIKSNRPVACLTNQFANWFYPYCFALQSKPSNPPSPRPGYRQLISKVAPPRKTSPLVVPFLLPKGGFKPIQSQQTGGLLEKPVRKLVFTLLLCPAKQAAESTFRRWKVEHFSDRSCLTTTIFRALRGYR